MPKKINKTNLKKEESDDEFYIEDEDNLDNIDNELDDEDEDIKEDYIEPDTDTNGCLIDDVINDDDEYFENEYDINENIQMNFCLKEDRISCNRLTKYEMVRILGERTKQLTMGAKPLVKNYSILSYEKIAEEELKLNMIPLKIIRPLPNGKFELWLLEELEKEHLYSQLE
jgi:DNA-directed RNA polymerase subunit K/omega